MDEIQKYFAENPVSKLVKEIMRDPKIILDEEGDEKYAVGLVCKDHFVVISRYHTREQLLVGYIRQMQYSKKIAGLPPFPEVTPVEFCDPKREKYKILDDVVAAFKNANDN